MLNIFQYGVSILGKEFFHFKSMYISHNNYEHVSSWCTGSDDLDPEKGTVVLSQVC